MKVSYKDKKKEAVDRMRKIGINAATIRQFEQDNIVSESVEPWGACYWITDKQQKEVKQFENENHGALVYHIIHGTYVFPDGEKMEMQCYLYVGDDRDDWQNDQRDIEDPDALQALCYVYNVSDPIFSEFGAVGFRVGPAGGLIRTA